MRCGLFGKVSPKRDFVAINAPRKFLDVWEPWLQSGMSASQKSLGDKWQDAFLKAPIWRFWLGGDVCGTAVIGAFMPSLDGVGRYYPLTVFACPEEGESIKPPELDPQADWFAATEDFLLSTLDHGVSYEAISGTLDQLAPPANGEASAAAPDTIALPDRMVAAVGSEQSFAESFASMRLLRHADVYASATFWWTIGGEGYSQFAVGGRRMPNPFLFTEMLTGRFAFGFDHPPAGEAE
jgi:type VI secretion system protein ImpM